MKQDEKRMKERKGWELLSRPSEEEGSANFLGIPQQIVPETSLLG